jgi:uncharacterized protein YabN with tetrapyrrole methylase and pyrophosphatase domain
METMKHLTNLENKAAEFGFKWETAEQIMAQIRSELKEIEVHLKDQDQEKLQDEIGDLLHAAFSLCIFCQFDPNKTLAHSVKKFEKRFNAIKQLTAAEGLNNLNGQTFQKLMEFWDKAKEISK